MAKNTTESKATTEAPKTETKSRERKTGLRRPQVRILELLAKSKKPLTRHDIKYGISQTADKPTSIGDALGLDDPEKAAAAMEKAGYPSLMALKFVKKLVLDIDGHKEICFEINAAGRRALEKANAAK